MPETAKSCFTLISNISEKLGKNDVTETLQYKCRSTSTDSFVSEKFIPYPSLSLKKKKVRIFFDSQPYLDKFIAKRKIRVLLPVEPWRMPVRD